MKPVLKTLLIFILTSTIYSQQKSYDIAFSTCLNKAVSKADFKNKYVVLDFWQTWCAPCIASFGETNELLKKYASSDIMFANITNEENKIDRIKMIFEINPFDGYQLIDDNNYVYNQFKVKAFPIVFILGKNGDILWEGDPAGLNEDLIFIKTGVKPTININTSLVKNEDYTLKIHDSNSEIIDSSIIKSDDTHYFINYNSASLHTILTRLLSISKKRIISTDSNSNMFGIDISSKFPKETYNLDKINDIIVKKLQSKYKFSIDTISQNEDGFLVKLIDAKQLKKWESNRYSSAFAKNKISLNGSTVYKAFLEYEQFDDNFYQIDELPNTISKKTFDFVLHKNKAKLESNIEKHYGLKLVKKNIAIKKLKLVFNEKITSKYNPTEKLEKLRELYIKDYNPKNSMGDWVFTAGGQEVLLKLFEDNEGKIDGKMVVDESIMKLKNIILTGNKMSFSASDFNLEIWFLNENTAKGHESNKMFFDLKKRE